MWDSDVLTLIIASLIRSLSRGIRNMESEKGDIGRHRWIQKMSGSWLSCIVEVWLVVDNGLLEIGKFIFAMWKWFKCVWEV